MNTQHQSRRISRNGRWLVVLVAVLGLAAPAAAGERILSFTSDLVVTNDGQMQVTETITVNAEGEKIKRGIYRDIPVRYGNDNFLGMRKFVPFQVTGIEYDGKQAAYHVDAKNDFHRIYIGEKNVAIPQGKHTYVIRYNTRQLRFFTDHDEVYWNATGNAWAFPIDKAVASVTLPATVPLDQIDPEGYVGSLDSKNQKDLTAEVDLTQRQVIYQTTRPLKAGEGLTIVARFPTGFISQQSTAAKLWSDPFLRWGSIGLTFVVAYFLIAWFLVGRDPPTGVILPLYEAPDGLSPAACRFISQMGYDKECFSVAILSLATQGALVIHEDDGDYVLEKTGVPATTASPGEQKVLAKLLNDKTTLAVDKKHHTRFSKAMNLLRKSLVNEFEGSQFRPNRLWFFAGVLIAIATLLGSVFIAGGFAISGEVGILTLWLTVWSIVVVALLHKVISAWRSFLVGSTALSRLAGVGSAIFIALFAVVPLLGAELFVLGWLASLTSLWLIPMILGVVTTVAVFHELLKAPTITGRSLMDKITGLRMYLATAEQDRLDGLTRQAFEQPQGSPEARSVELFERFLPYAVALDVANQWAEQFKDLIEAASVDASSQQSAGYHPAWYQGNAWSAASIGAAAAGLGTAMTSAVAAAATSPSSSSGGGGGGSSGGGGGGGGGGGW